MFEYSDLDKMGRAALVNEQKAAVEYWRSVHRLQGLILAYGSQTQDLIDAYTAAGGSGPLSQALALVQWKGQITWRKLGREIDKVNGYLRQIDARLADGAKWYTAQEIAEMTTPMNMESYDPIK